VRFICFLPESWANESVGEDFFLHLICETSVFVPIPNDSYYQLTGGSLADLPATYWKSSLKRKRASQNEDSGRMVRQRCYYGLTKRKTNNEVIIERSRMFYARPLLDAKQMVHHGLSKTHVLNRAATVEAPAARRILLSTVFPMQFGLPNIFSGDHDRELALSVHNQAMTDHLRGRLPCNLRQQAEGLLGLLQRHRRCPYKDLLDHYCPSPLKERLQARSVNESGGGIVQAPQGAATASSSDPIGLLNCHRKEAFADYQSQPAHVIAWLRSVMSHLLPSSLLSAQRSEIFLQSLPTMITMRRFETLTLHFYLQGMRQSIGSQRNSLSQAVKDKEVLSELIYWLLSSLVIPMIRSHFYVTESHMFRNRVLFFRHDVWRRLTEPEICRVKSLMFRELVEHEARHRLDSRDLGFSYVRFLPKEVGARPITNLRLRQMVTQVFKNQTKRYLAPSVNAIMQAVHSVLSSDSCSKGLRASFAIASVQDMYMRLEMYKKRMRLSNFSGKFYLCKVDIKDCFDSIDVGLLLRIVADVLLEDHYMLRKYCALHPGLASTFRKYSTKASPLSNFQSFPDFAQTFAVSKRHIILSDGVLCQIRERDELLALLEEHLTMNIVKIGHTFHKQIAGIPQGSVLSSLLCNLYYNDFENRKLAWARNDHSVGFRMVDDFLYITTDLSLAKRFLKVMHAGSDEYACTVNPSKSLANFDVSVCSQKVQCLSTSLNFPVSHHFEDRN
jgi:telomerase reverse transcriptase